MVEAGLVQLLLLFIGTLGTILVAVVTWVARGILREVRETKDEAAINSNRLNMLVLVLSMTNPDFGKKWNAYRPRNPHGVLSLEEIARELGVELQEKP